MWWTTLPSASAYVLSSRYDGDVTRSAGSPTNARTAPRVKHDFPVPRSPLIATRLGAGGAAANSAAPSASMSSSVAASADRRAAAGSARAA